jgi:NADP-dependent 3-hydroxy-3-methylglutaryl-CoA reductase
MNELDPARLAELWSAAYDAREPGVPALPVAARGAGDSLLMPFRGHHSRDRWEKRAAWLRQITGEDLPHLTDIQVDPAQMQGHVENFIGTVPVPVGLAGPLRVRGDHIDEDVYAPFATTEGALVASATRGAAALTRAGGVRVRVVHQRMTRAPVFVMRSIDVARRLCAWIADHRAGIEAEIAASSQHATLVSIDPILIGRYLHLRFVYETGDAAGQNMTTLATWRACQWIRGELVHHPEMQAEHVFIEGNTSGDKKATPLNATSGRGTRVTAEAQLSASVLRRCLKVSPDALLAAFQAGATGSAWSGTAGVNANVANVVAAVFTATGQDIASVHESSVAQVHVEAREGGVYASIVLPCLVVGTVGGGTDLPAQRDALCIMRCDGTGKVRRLAEIVCGFALALELSTMAAIAAGEFAAAHETLGRPRRETGVLASELSPEFFTRALGAGGGPSLEGVTVTRATPFALEDNDSILSDLAAGRTGRLVGLFPYELEWARGEARGTTRVLVKSKPADRELVGLMNSMAKLCGDPIALLHDVHRFETGFKGAHLRELAIAGWRHPAIARIAPRAYATLRRDPSHEDRGGAYVMTLEWLDDVSHFHTVDRPEAWEPSDIEVALRDIAAFHAAFLDRTADLLAPLHLEPTTIAVAHRLAPLWDAILTHNQVEMPAVFTPGRVEKLRGVIGSVGPMWTRLRDAPQTLVHGDFNLRNICLRRGPEVRLCAYDWELATVHVPQRDVCELLAYALRPGEPMSTRLGYVDFYRGELERAAKRTFPARSFRSVYALASLDFAISRLGLVSVAHVFKSYDYLPRVLESHFEYLDTLDVAEVLS